MSINCYHNSIQIQNTPAFLKYQLVQIQNGIFNCAPCKVKKIENITFTNTVPLEPPENIRLWLAIWLLDYHNYNCRRIIREAKKDGKISEIMGHFLY